MVKQLEQYSLDAVDTSGCGLRVVFFRCKDRLAHRIVVVHGAATDILFQSREGNGGQAFPPSPALQQADFQPRAKMPAVGLLLGMAGRNHWSLSVQAYPIQRRLVFDVACACPYETNVQFETTYTLKTPYSLSCHSPDRQRRGLELEIDLPTGFQSVYCGSMESGSDVTASMDQRNKYLMMSPTNASWPGTVRWQYEIQLLQTVPEP